MHVYIYTYIVISVFAAHVYEYIFKSMSILELKDKFILVPMIWNLYVIFSYYMFYVNFLKNPSMHRFQQILVSKISSLCILFFTNILKYPPFYICKKWEIPFVQVLFIMENVIKVFKDALFLGNWTHSLTFGRKLMFHLIKFRCSWGQRCGAVG